MLWKPYFHNPSRSCRKVTYPSLVTHGNPSPTISSVFPVSLVFFRRRLAAAPPRAATLEMDTMEGEDNNIQQDATQEMDRILLQRSVPIGSGNPSVVAVHGKVTTSIEVGQGVAHTTYSARQPPPWGLSWAQPRPRGLAVAPAPQGTEPASWGLVGPPPPHERSHQRGAWPGRRR